MQKKSKAAKKVGKQKKVAGAVRTGSIKKDKISTRDYLLHVAAQSLLESGVHGLRYSQISKLAEVPQPLMGYHFPTIESLMMEMVQVNVEKLRSVSTLAVEKYSQDPLKALEAYIRAPFELAAKDPQFRAVWSAFYHLTTVYPDFADLNRQVRAFGRQRITTLITMALAMEKKLTESMHQLERLAISVQGIITGLGFMAGTQSDGDYQHMADLAVQTTFEVLDIEK